MEIESFTISDESFALVEAHRAKNLERVRAERSRRKLECLSTCEQGKFCHHIASATAYERTLLHESLIDDLEKLAGEVGLSAGLAEWTRQGKKELCERLTDHAIRIGRGELPSPELDVSDIRSPLLEEIRQLSAVRSEAKPHGNP